MCAVLQSEQRCAGMHYTLLLQLHRAPRLNGRADTRIAEE